MTALSINTRTPLSRLRIARAALAIVDRDGLEALAMRRLGAELGVEGMAIYRHFPNKAAVLAGIVEVLLAELVIPPPSDVPWQAVFREVSRAYRALLLRHPHAIPLLAALPLSDPAAARAAGAVPTDADPYLVELMPQLAAGDCDETFEFGLDVIVRGLETRS